MDTRVSMKYIVIRREITNAEWMIRVLDSGDTEILEPTDNYYEEDVTNPFDVDGVSYFWEEWADKDLFKRVWIDDAQQNGDDVTMTEFEDFNEAFNFLWI